MSDSTSTEQPAEEPVETPAMGDETDWKAEAEKWKQAARKAQDHAKTNATAVKELEQLRQQSMSEQEKSIAQARAEGLQEGYAAGAAEIAAEAVRAAASGRMTDQQIEALITRTNLASFIGDDAQVDRAAIRVFVDDIAPKPDDEDKETRQGFPDLGQGARGGGQNTALNGDPLLRDIKSKLNIK
jgi:hypothetical protein